MSSFGEELLEKRLYGVHGQHGVGMHMEEFPSYDLPLQPIPHLQMCSLTRFTAGDAARDGRTIVSSKCSSTAVGFLQQPVCTGEVWIVVLRGATSQRKRSPGESWPIGPAGAPPAQMVGMAARWSRTV